MEERELYRMIDQHEATVSMVFPALMRKVFSWMTLALVITGLTAYGVASNESIMFSLYSSQWIIFGLIALELGLVIYLSARIQKLSLTTATVCFILFSVVNGLTLAPIFIIYTGSSIAKVFFITAGTFAAMALIGYRTKKDLSMIGRILIMALIGLIIASLVNLFLKSSGLELILSYVGVLIFVGLTAWDTQEIKQMLNQCEAPDEEAQKIALLGSLTLYLDFINLFLYLLRIFGNRE